LKEALTGREAITMAIDDVDVTDKVLICGGGIAGLAVGLALAKVLPFVDKVMLYELRECLQSCQMMWVVHLVV
jgi:heterodisulfide reductase subunit A-like polyferredoxin